LFYPHIEVTMFISSACNELYDFNLNFFSIDTVDTSDIIYPYFSPEVIEKSQHIRVIDKMLSISVQDNTTQGSWENRKLQTKIRNTHCRSEVRFCTILDS
jgi:hypothetical protein